jgi:hypothetical protein
VECSYEETLGTTPERKRRKLVPSVPRTERLECGSDDDSPLNWRELRKDDGGSARERGRERVGQDVGEERV